MKYKSYLMSELIADISMGPFGSNIKAECYQESGVPYLNGSNVTGFSLNEDSFRYVSEEKADSLGRSVAHRNDVIVTHRGTLGQIAYIPSNSRFERYVTGNSQFRFTCNDKVLPEYVVLYFHTPKGQNELLSNASQVGVPALARPTSTFQKLQICIPEIEYQKKVCGLFHAIQDKIELNRAINENLQQQAQAIFASEFFSGGDLPSGWSKSNLLGIADYLNGLAMQKFRPKENEEGYPVLKIKELRQGFCDTNSERCSVNIKPEYVIHDGDVIFSWSGSLLVDFWCGGTCGINQHLFKVTSSKYDKWFYYAWTMHHLQRFIAIAADMATTMGHIKREELSKAEVLIPSPEDYSRIGDLLKPIYDLIIANRLEARKLSALRDDLLPKLMSGEIDVSEVEYE